MIDSLQSTFEIVSEESFLWDFLLIHIAAHDFQVIFVTI